MDKIYYQKSTGFVCGRLPRMYQASEEDLAELEVSSEVFMRSLSCPYGQLWAVVDGELKLVPDEAERATKAYKISVLESERSSLKRYLSDTDYVIAKLNELKLEGDDSYEEQKASYAGVFAKRRESRKRVSEIDAEIAELESAE